MEEESSRGIRVSGMQFAYDAQQPLFVEFSLEILPGSRCLLVGANGSGKTTLLKILAGKHMVGGRDAVRVLNGSAFHDTHLVCSGDLSYLGGSWSKTVGCAGEIPLQGDFSAEHMIFGVEGVDPVRREKLIELLDIDLQWRMHKVSDGQRRRVQICMGLLHPFQVLLLDEVTVDLDVVARLDLLDFFKEECEQRGATIVYATHIFDGLETWATDLAYIQDGELKRTAKLSELGELKNSANLLSVVESWLRSETKQEKKKPANPSTKIQKTTSPFDNSPFRSSRHMAYYRGIPSDIRVEKPKVNRFGRMYLQFYINENGDKVYTTKKESPLGLATQSAHPARFSPDDKFSRQRVLLKKRFGLLPTQKPPPKY